MWEEVGNGPKARAGERESGEDERGEVDGTYAKLPCPKGRESRYLVSRRMGMVGRG